MNKQKLFFNGLSVILFSLSINVHAETSINQDEAARFTKTIAYIKEYSAQEVKDQTLLENAMNGMLSGLDAHSNYLDKDAYKALSENTDGEFAGLGLELTPENGAIKVIAPLDDSPAAKAGIKAGDYIVEINQKTVKNMTLNDAIKLLKGPPGTSVTLMVIRKGETSPLKFNLKRQIIHIVSVKSELLPDGYAYLRISQFQENTAKDTANAIAELARKNKGKLSGLILDLRNNPGGLLTSAIKVCDLFIDSKKTNAFNNVIVSTKGRNESSNMQATAVDGDLLLGAPMIVLINEGSASASEIVSGALQDYKRAIIVGKQSFGKGSVQTVLPLDKDHAIKLTTALYYTPAGRSIQAQGITPDIIVEDLELKQANADAIILQPIKEADLKGHIKNESSRHASSNTSDTSIAEQDYQLAQALNILKALHIANENMTKEIKASS